MPLKSKLMMITKVELENIKSHTSSSYDLLEGTTAIIGENGAGKTSLIEAIAWVLFDHLEYKKDDFVRRGAKKGVVRVTIVSALDGREYLIERDTDTTYTVLDVEMNTKLASGKLEVSNFLRTHLGLDRSIDPKMLFKCAIGVPQGTFTSDFLRPPSERKLIFDKLLRVEEYKKASEQLIQTQRVAENKINELKISTSHIEGQLVSLTSLREKEKQLQERLNMLVESLELMDQEISDKQKLVYSLNETFERIRRLESTQRELLLEKSKEEKSIEEKKKERDKALEAQKKVKRFRRDHERYLEISNQLETLRSKILIRDDLKRKEIDLRDKVSELENEVKIIKQQLKQVEEAQKEIISLRRSAERQKELEEKILELQRRLATEIEIQRQIQNRQQKIEKLRESYKQKSNEIANLKAKIAETPSLDQLNERYRQLVDEIARIQAEIEADERFKKQIKDGLCPILSQRCLNIAEGETLENYVSLKSKDLVARVNEIESEKGKIQKQLKLAQEAESIRAKLQSLQEEIEKIWTEGTQLKNEKEELERQLKELEALKPDYEKLIAELNKLGNPSAKIEFLSEQAKNRNELIVKSEKLEKELSKLRSERENILSKLKDFDKIDAEWEKLHEEQKKLSAGHQEFLVNKNLADSVDERKIQLEEALSNLENISRKLTEIDNELSNIRKNYDEQSHQTEIQNLKNLEENRLRKKFDLEEARKNIESVRSSINELEEKQKELEQYKAQIEKFEKIHEVITFIREILKKSGPMIAQNLVETISGKATQIFREIMGNFDLTLKWKDDYEIVLEEQGRERPFLNLSGGEQMAAALSIRLSLLEQLSDIRIAFFDEPTTNMDEIRREGLAEQIRIITETKRFKQLFVISHDDTFESRADNVIHIQKQK